MVHIPSSGSVKGQHWKGMIQMLMGQSGMMLAMRSMAVVEA